VNFINASIDIIFIATNLIVPDACPISRSYGMQVNRHRNSQYRAAADRRVARGPLQWRQRSGLTGSGGLALRRGLHGAKPSPEAPERQLCFGRAVMMDVDQAAKAMRDEEMLAEIEDFIEGFNQPTYRGMRINGQRVATWSSQHGWSGDSRPEAEWLQ
jgi:hypothetical protein